MTQLVTVGSSHAHKITTYNMFIVANSAVWTVPLVAYLLIEYQNIDYFNILAIPILVLLKLFQNYIVCVLEGGRIVAFLGFKKL